MPFTPCCKMNLNEIGVHVKPHTDTHTYIVCLHTHKVIIELKSQNEMDINELGAASHPSTQVSVVGFHQWPQIEMGGKITAAKFSAVTSSRPHELCMVVMSGCDNVMRTFLARKIIIPPSKVNETSILRRTSCHSSARQGLKLRSHVTF